MESTFDEHVATEKAQGRCGDAAGAAWLGRNACVPKAWVLDDVIPHVAHACLLFYLVRLYVTRGLPHTVWGKSVAGVKRGVKARAMPKATRSSARVRSRKAKGE